MLAGPCSRSVEPRLCALPVASHRRRLFLGAEGRGATRRVVQLSGSHVFLRQRREAKVQFLESDVSEGTALGAVDLASSPLIGGPTRGHRPGPVSPTGVSRAAFHVRAVSCRRRPAAEKHESPRIALLPLAAAAGIHETLKTAHSVSRRRPGERESLEVSRRRPGGTRGPGSLRFRPPPPLWQCGAKGRARRPFTPISSVYLPPRRSIPGSRDGAVRYLRLWVEGRRAGSLRPRVSKKSVGRAGPRRLFSRNKVALSEISPERSRTALWMPGDV